jgi:thiol-disulfide isomerase/thioredoxin
MLGDSASVSVQMSADRRTPALIVAFCSSARPEGFMRSLLVAVVLSTMLLSCQNNESTVTGQLLGADGNPMPLAHVRLADATLIPASMSRLHGPILKAEEVHANGTFKISTRDSGPLVLMCTGVGHEELCIPLPLDRPTDLSLDIRLARAFCDTSRSEIEILTSSDNGATTQTLSLAKLSDGSFRADIPAVGDSVLYMIFSTGPKGTATTLIGATALRYQVAVRNEYVSVVPATNGHAIIEYRTPQRSVGQGETVTYADSSSIVAVFARLQDNFARHVASASLALQSHLLNGLPVRSLAYPWLEFADTLAKAATQTDNRLLKDELALEVLECHERAAVRIHDQDRCDIIANVLPTSLAWTYHGSLGLATRHLPQMGDEYFLSILDNHPSRSYAAYLLFCECAEANQTHNDSKVLRILSRLETEFGNTSAAQEALALYSPRNVIRVGSVLPEFAFSAAEDSSVILTNASFHGKHLLMVFWGTWCTPCVGEMPALHRTYEKYGAIGLKILSVSLANSPSQIANFRKWRWPMPWSVVVVPKEKVPSVSGRFNASAGTHILVDPAGKILKVGGLKEMQLDSTLSHLL